MMAQFEYNHDYFPPAPIIEITIDGYAQNVEPVFIRAMIDSGADGTMIPAEVLAKVEAIYTDSVRMSGVTGEGAQRDRYRVRLQIGEIVIRGIDAVATDFEDVGLIGRDVLNQLIVTLNGLATETIISEE